MLWAGDGRHRSRDRLLENMDRLAEFGGFFLLHFGSGQRRLVDAKAQIGSAISDRTLLALRRVAADCFVRFGAAGNSIFGFLA